MDIERRDSIKEWLKLFIEKHELNEMVFIPGGKFRMGFGDEGDIVEHDVYLSPYYIDKYPVTNAQYLLFVLENQEWRRQGLARDSSKAESEPRSERERRTASVIDIYYLCHWYYKCSELDNLYIPCNLDMDLDSRAFGDLEETGLAELLHPVVWVNYAACEAYATWCGKRLPTEAEWERAAKDYYFGSKVIGSIIGANGTVSLFSIGLRNTQGDLDSGNIPEDLLYGFEKEKLFLPQNATVSTEERGRIWRIADTYTVEKKGEELNVSAVPEDVFWIAKERLRRVDKDLIVRGQDVVHDILGNAAELCFDWYDRTYYQWCKDRGIENPTGPSYGTEKVSRGYSRLCGSSEIPDPFTRFPVSPWAIMPDVGFRCVRSPANYRELQRVAVTSLVVDSYAHNLGAHSGMSLVHWFRERIKDLDAEREVLDKTDLIPEKELVRECLEYLDELDKPNITSISDLLRRFPRLLLGNVEGMPLPLDHHVHSYLKYLNEKAAFWTGTVSGNIHGGQLISLCDLLSEFADNPLFLGTIAETEGIQKLEIAVQVGKTEEGVDGAENFDEFATIDISEARKNRSTQVLDMKPENLEDMKEEMVYLPGGVIGKQAFYTILENIIRNIAYAEKTLPGAGDEKKISLAVKLLSQKDHWLVKAWLRNKSKFESVSKEAEKVNNNLREPIITPEGAPRMGGQYQEKVCASLLYNGDLRYVDDMDDPAPDGQRRYPWIRVEAVGEHGDRLAHLWRMWKGEELHRVSNKEEVAGIMMPERYKIIAAEDRGIAEEVKRETGVVRVVSGQPEGSDFAEVYRTWLERWLINKSNVEVEVFDKDQPQRNKRFCFEPSTAEGDRKFSFEYHAGDENTYRCRSHGKLAYLDFNNEEHVLEIVETLLTKIYIIDNRIWRIYDELKSGFKERLEDIGLIVREETTDNFPDSGDDINFLVVHLRYIQNPTYGLGREKMNDFIEDFIKGKMEVDLNRRDNFGLVITTGRGRKEWWDSLKGDYRRFTLARQINPIQQAFLTGVAMRDHFEPKYNLCKVLFGS